MKKREDGRIPVPSDVAKRLFEGMRAAVDNNGSTLIIRCSPLRRVIRKVPVVFKVSVVFTGNRVDKTVREGD